MLLTLGSCLEKIHFPFCSIEGLQQPPAQFKIRWKMAFYLPIWRSPNAWSLSVWRPSAVTGDTHGNLILKLLLQRSLLLALEEGIRTSHLWYKLGQDRLLPFNVTNTSICPKANMSLPRSPGLCLSRTPRHSLRARVRALLKGLLWGLWTRGRMSCGGLYPVPSLSRHPWFLWAMLNVLTWNKHFLTQCVCSTLHPHMFPFQVGENASPG